MKSLNIILISVVFLLLGISCSTENEMTVSEIQKTKNAKKVDELAIKNGLDINKVHFDFGDKVVSEEHWNELDNALYKEGLFALKNKERFAYNTEFLKVQKEMYAHFPLGSGDVTGPMHVKMKYKKGKTLQDLYKDVIIYPDVFSKELIEELRTKLNE